MKVLDKSCIFQSLCLLIIDGIKERKNILKMNKEIGILLLKKELIQVSVLLRARKRGTVPRINSSPPHIVS